MKDKIMNFMLSKKFARGFGLVMGATMGFLLCDIGRHSGFVEGANWMDGSYKEALKTLKDNLDSEESAE